MNARFVKKIYNSLPESIKMIFGKPIRYKLINNPVFKEEYELLEQADRMSDMDKEKIQFELLKRTCIHAYENTSYYKKIFDKVAFDPYAFYSFEEFKSKVPILTKQMVLDNYEDINVHSITDDYPSTTGGSSGTRLQINNAWETLYKENAFDYHFESKFGYDYKKHKILLIAGEESEALCSISPLYNMIRVSGRHLNEQNMNIAMEFINRNKPDFIKGLPSAVYQFCKYLKFGGYTIKKPIKYVFFRSENINPKQRAFIEETLQCKSAAFYGATERVAWGEEINNIDGMPLYKFNPLYGYMEVDLKDGETIISTGFINPKMPLIRYRTDDSVKEFEKNIYSVEGHRSASLIGKNGENISVEYFCHLEETFDKVEKYQINQYEKGKMIVDIVPRKKMSTVEVDNIANMFFKMCAGCIDVEIQIVDHVQLTSRGKFKLLYHSIEQN